MQPTRLVRNAGAAAAQVLVSGLTLFLLYRYLLQAVGVERLGLWSVVLATTSAARLTELGFTGSVVKFVAGHLGRGDRERAALAVQTAVLALAVFVGALLLAAWLPAAWLLERMLPAASLREGLQLLPYALLSLWLTTLAGIFQSALDGCQRTDLRATFAVSNSVLQLLLALVFVPAYGLLGLAGTQVALTLLLLVSSWYFLRRELTALPWLPRRWSQPEFRAMFRYGLHIQVATLLQALTDPVTKALLAKFGGLAMTGFYEMASRMLMQLRGLLVAPNQIVVPVIAQIPPAEAARVDALYRDTYRLQAYLALPFYGAIAASLPAVSRLWIGHLEPTFLVFAALLTVGWWLNGYINPAYFANLGLGRPGPNTWSHAAMGVLNVALGLSAGLACGGVGVVAGWIVALVLGSSIVLIEFHHARRLSLEDALPRDNAGLALACLAAIAAAWGVQTLLADRLPALLTLCLVGVAFGGLIAYPAWRHPMRHRLGEILRRARTEAFAGPVHSAART